MAKDTDPRGSADWVREKIAALRAMLEAGEWPATADRLLDDLRAAGEEPAALTDEDMAMLSLVLGDALQGVDVATRYPRFFEKLLANEGLREAFLDGLTLLDEREMFAPPGTVPADTLPPGFLRTPVTTAVVEADDGGWWRAEWLQLKGTLEWLFSPRQQAPGMAWRSAEGGMEEGYRTLLRSETLVGEQILYVALDGRQPMEKPNVLEVVLMVAADGEGKIGPLRARLEWGEYEDTAVLDEWGEATFAPVPLEAVWEEGMTADLRLTVESQEHGARSEERDA
jgi:hypothetical protein